MAKRLMNCHFNHIRKISCSYMLSSNVQRQIELKTPKHDNTVEKSHKSKDTQLADKIPISVDLRNTKGITVKHITKETEHSALFKYCLDTDPSPDGFINAVDVFKNKNKQRQGHVDFITTGMKFIEAYGLEKHSEVYDSLMDVFPRERFRNRSILDAFWPKPHPQINLALDLLTKMEWQGIIPSQEMHDTVHEIFGSSSFPLQKIYRMWFWLQEFANLNPYQLPEETYKDRINVLKAVSKRFYETDDGFEILELSNPVEDETSDMINYKHFLISSQSPVQKKYVGLCLPNQVLYIEGPYHVWINRKMEEYFVLKNGRNGFLSDGIHVIDVDEQKEGVVLAMCFTTKPYQESLQKWWRHLQDTNTSLSQFNVVFNIFDDVNRISVSNQLEG